MNPLITLAELVAEGFGSSLYGGPTIDALAAQLAACDIDVVLDDIGRRAIKRADARALLTERAQQQAAAQAAQAAQASAAGGNKLHAVLRARRERQLALRREHPELNAYAIMALTNGEPERDLDRAGRRFDELADASRRGIVGVMHRFPQSKKG